jgi:hypothetical protein
MGPFYCFPLASTESWQNGSTTATIVDIVVFFRVATMDNVTQIISEIERGDSSAADRLLPPVYNELRQLAAAKLAQEKLGQTLQATSLVHEAYLRLVGSADREPAPWDSRGHFFAATGEAVRRILVEQARHKSRIKRGGELQRVDFDSECAYPNRRRLICWRSMTTTRIVVFYRAIQSPSLQALPR